MKRQNYKKLRKHHRELGVPWTDPTFPASDGSVGLKKSRDVGRVEWRRISDLSQHPRLVAADGLDKTDIKQVKSVVDIS